MATIDETIYGQLRPPGPSSPRHHPDEVASDSAPAGAATADQLARSRQLYPCRRWSPEQKRLRTQLRGQQRAGRSFDQLRHVGAVVLHARRLPHSAQPVDHLIVTAGATFAVHDLAATRREPIAWTYDGHLVQAGVDTETLEASLADGVAVMASVTAEILGPGWRTWVVPIIAVTGAWPHPPTCASTGIVVGTPDALCRWMIQAFTPTLDALDIATMANAASRACPNANA
ncbi:MAG TPA: hypothetical protein VFU35_16020 [Jatrophihabitans sp.]|nr:hypothetical protein [Jatrophihabitans sp.]